MTAASSAPGAGPAGAVPAGVGNALLSSPIRWIGGRVAVCFSARDAENAHQVWEAGEGSAIVSLEAAKYADESAFSAAVFSMLSAVPVLSVALGGGADPKQWGKVMAGGLAGAQHLNQPFSTAAFVKGRVAGRANSWVNGVVRPSGTPGTVLMEMVDGSAVSASAVDASRLLKESSVDALKFHPARGVEILPEVVAASSGAVAAGLVGFEPAGGIGPDNIVALTRAVLATGIPYFLPHVFGSVVDKATGRTRPEAVAAIMHDLRELF